MKLGVCQMAVSENLGINTKKIISFIKKLPCKILI